MHISFTMCWPLNFVLPCSHCFLSLVGNAPTLFRDRWIQGSSPWCTARTRHTEGLCHHSGYQRPAFSRFLVAFFWGCVCVWVYFSHFELSVLWALILVVGTLIAPEISYVYSPNPSGDLGFSDTSGLEVIGEDSEGDEFALGQGLLPKAKPWFNAQSYRSIQVQIIDSREPSPKKK